MTAGRLFPLSLASEGSCRIGGNLSTNAGGLNVLAYGNARDLCLGLEVVLPDGRVWNGLRRLRKDNTGYDLKNLFIGAEGTLGVITAAVLKLFPKPRRHETAFIAVTSPQAAVDLLAAGKGDERQPGGGFRADAADRHGFHREAHGDQQSPGGIFPLVCAERTGRSRAGSFEAILEEAMARGLVTDATVAQSETQAAGPVGHPRTDAGIAEVRGRLDQA